MRGAIVGVLILAGLEAVVSSADAANRAGGILTAIGGLVDRFLDPTVAAIPDRRGAVATTTASSSPPSTGPAGPPRHAHTAATGSNGPVGPGI